MTTNPATEAQVNYITSLLSQRVVPEKYSAIVPSELTRLEASLVIESLKGAAFKPRPAAQANPLSAMLAEKIPASKYALPFEELSLLLPEFHDSRGHLFLEVRSYRGTTYMRRLHGSVGDFTRSKLSPLMVTNLVRYMENRTLEFVQEFGRLFTCCGKCSAPLTDERSRELSLGPDCRKAFGL